MHGRFLNTLSFIDIERAWIAISRKPHRTWCVIGDQLSNMPSLGQWFWRNGRCIASLAHEATVITFVILLFNCKIFRLYFLMTKEEESTKVGRQRLTCHWYKYQNNAFLLVTAMEVYMSELKLWQQSMRALKRDRVGNMLENGRNPINSYFSYTTL